MAENAKNPMKKRKFLSIGLSITIALFLLSISIACPFLFRVIYYAQIDSLHLSESTGYSRETIKEAFDSIMDYCTGYDVHSETQFSTGDLAWTETGKAHFDDVKQLVHLDFHIAVITGSLLFLYVLIRLLLWFRAKHHNSETGKKLISYRFLKRGPLFWGPAALLAFFMVLGGAAVMDYDAFFAWFHHLVFPGKENWLLTPSEDEIIRILPEEVFQNYALFILGILAAGCLACILADIIMRRNCNRQNDTDR